MMIRRASPSSGGQCGPQKQRRPQDYKSRNRPQTTTPSRYQQAVAAVITASITQTEVVFTKTQTDEAVNTLTVATIGSGRLLRSGLDYCRQSGRPR